MSLFNGMGCIWVALDRLGVKVNRRYACEIDKYANIINDKNYPDTIQLGDVRDVEGWELEPIDLLVGGSPCQGFSFAGKQLNFDDPRSKLFFEYVRLLKETKPKYFLLENVKMVKKSQDVISDILGVEPILINSALVSAQNRNRLYWTNIPNIEQPKDKKVVLKDVIEYGNVDRHKSYCLDANYYKGGNLKTYFCKSRRQLVFDKPIILQRGRGFNRGGIKASNGKTPTLSACAWEQNNKITTDGIKFRKLTPVECERLQTLPDNYSEGVSNTQRYKMLGNGWTVDVIVHLLKNMNYG